MLRKQKSSAQLRKETVLSMKRLCLLLAGLVLFILPSAFASTVTTDKPIYAPGEVVTFRGEDWAPGEPVTIVVTAEGGREATTLRAVADSTGAFELTATMPDADDAPSSARVLSTGRAAARLAGPDGARYRALARGSISGASSQAAFSEGEAETDGARLLQLEDYWHQRLTIPTGKFNPGWVRKAADDDKKIPRGKPKGKKKGQDGLTAVTTSAGKFQAGVLSLDPDNFISLGPQPEHMTGCTGCYNYTTTQGRVNNIAIDPTTTTPGSITAYIGTVGGGVWKSTNCCSASTTWTVLTDDPLISTTSIDTVTLDPNNHNIVYAGTGDLNYGSFSMGSQGILKSIDGGANWTILGSSIFGPALPESAGQFPQYNAVGKVRVDPNNSNNVVAGTKLGLYFSYDGGANWTGPCLTNAFSTMRQDITALELTNMGGGVTRILAAVGARGFATTVQYNLNQNGANGIYSANMAASGCPSFTSIAGNGNGFKYQSTATSAYPANANMNAGSGTAYVSSSSGNQLGRVDMAVAPGNSSVIYAQVQSITPNNDSGCGNANGCQLGVWVTTNGGTSWSFMGGSAGFSLKKCGAGAAAGSGDYPQNWYDQAVAVDPNNADRVFISTFDVWFATRTGTTFNDTTCGYSFSGSAGPVHTDQHALAFLPGSSSTLVLGNDGGVHGATNANSASSSVDPTWFNMDTGLNTIEFYSGDISGNFATSGSPQVSGGAQDNGPSSASFAGSPTGPVQWQMGLGGDGFYSRIDPVGTGSNLRFWQGNNSGGLSRCISNCTASGATWTSKKGGWGSDTQSFILPFDIFRGGISGGTDCPAAGASGGCGRLVAATTRVWETITGNAANSNGTVTWYVTNNPSTQNLTKQTLGNRSFINQVKYAPKTHTVAIAGTNDGNVQIGFNLGTGVASQATWVNVTDSNAVLPNRPILGIAIDPTTTTSPIAYAAVGGFDANTPSTTGHLFRVDCTANCASFTWTNKTGNLPDIPVDSVIVNPNIPAQVFAGTDIGLYFTDDITATPPVWQRFIGGLPSVMIWDMQIDRGATTLSLWTRGRGAFVWPLPTL